MGTPDSAIECLQKLLPLYLFLEAEFQFRHGERKRLTYWHVYRKVGMFEIMEQKFDLGKK